MQMSGNMEKDLFAAAFEWVKERIYSTKVLNLGYLIFPFVSLLDKIIFYILSKESMSSSGLKEKFW